MFLLTKEQQKLRAELREFVDHEVCPVATELDNRGGFPHDLYARIGKMGYLDAEFEYIGSGAKYGSLEGTIIIEELSRGLASLGLIVSPHYQCTELIACCGTETLKKKVIEPARRGEQLFAFAISEERGGSIRCAGRGHHCRKGRQPLDTDWEKMLGHECRSRRWLCRHGKKPVCRAQPQYEHVFHSQRRPRADGRGKPQHDRAQQLADGTYYSRRVLDTRLLPCR